MAISREHAQNSRSMSSSHCFKNSEIIHEYALKFLVRKNFPHLKGLNEFIQMASAGGLINKWLQIGRIRNLYEMTRRGFGQLMMGNFYGAHIVYGSLILVVFMVIIIEKITYKKAKEPKPMKFWLIVEMIIDGDRYFLLENKM